MIKVNKRVVGPELRPQFLPAHHFTRAFEQQTQDLERLLSHLHFRPELSQLTGAQIERMIVDGLFAEADPELESPGLLQHGVLPHSKKRAIFAGTIPT